ncbi:hypothetical protein RM572_00715 [Streptomyces sp. DSM 42041]|uniref:Uncharacterized protein n=1 Tax=Streptomyces hazeniae TaxID=3075538 RepID=A0ABU2NML6_9ACTN|nr:hypothetical protein [Streptomyces sp. DSM 42041]MDT0377297.1 hypothetical protein [Streptomyces sp. DSM 42041]
MLTPAAAAVLAALATGYLLGRLRPLDRLDTWVWRQLTFRKKWTRARPRQAVLLAVHALVRPAATVHIWRHRHDPPTPRSPAITVPAVPDNSEEPTR